MPDSANTARDPFPVLQTKRLILREMTEDDIPALYDLFSDPDVTEYLDIEPIRSLIEAEMILNLIRRRYRAGTGIHWGIARRDDNRVIGTLALHDLESTHRRAQIGYELKSSHWRQGIVSEALLPVLEYGFETLDLHRIEAMTNIKNTASVAFLRAMRFQDEGVLHDYFFLRGQFVSVRVFSLLRPAYRVQRTRDITRWYDLMAEPIMQAWASNETLLPALREFVALLPEHPSVLDVGCGTGHESKRLATLDARVIGIDLSEGSLRIAREHAPECHFETLDMRDLDQRFGQFDGVLAAGSLIHITPHDLPDVMARIGDVLKPGGYLLAVVHDGDGPRVALEKTTRNWLQRTIYRYSLESLRAASAAFEFQREIMLPALYANIGWRMYLFRRG